MPPQAPSSYYATHGALTDPGRHGPALETFPRGVAALCRIVQGLLIHDSYGQHLYGPAPADFHRASRETLPLSRRLDTILAARDAPLTSPRPPFRRSIGTCRDFALMLCALLREQEVPARVRCGFADYFDPGRYEDHWVCEYWKPAEGRWALADAQLDEAHRAHLAIDFDGTDLPRARFLPAARAWQRVRSGAADPALFGHGDDKGAWFIRVNLARDLLSLCKQEVSPWDGWRSARQQDRRLDQSAILQCDRIAALAEAADGLAPPVPDEAADGFLASPPWHG